jgi:predicted ATPase
VRAGGVPLGPIIGRESALARIDTALASGARLVTILGPPGIGKTRLAQELLARRAVRYEGAGTGGAWFCDLGEARDEDGLVHAAASMWPWIDPARLTEHFVASGPTLMVLDNFEQLVAAGHVVRAWCERAPELRVVVTSRERLAVEGETCVELEPLACPGEDDPPDAILASEAVRLLVARSAAVGTEMRKDPRVLGALARGLDGLPLAIELAAARARVLSPAELLARLGARFDLLATLAGAIEWSWKLLSSHEQEALAQCSVFAGGFTLEAAESVISVGAADAGAPATMDLVAALRDKSLVHAAGTEGRLGLYVSIRDYAVARLEERGPGEAAGEGGAAAKADAVRWRHARHYAAAVRPCNEARTMQGLEPDAALRVRMMPDRENVLAALAFVRRRPIARREDVSVLAELAIGATLLHAASGETCRDALVAGLDALEAVDSGNVVLRARLMLALREPLVTIGRIDEARRDLDAVARLDGLPGGLRALALVMIGIQLRYESRPAEALGNHEEAARLLEGLGLPRLRAMNWACMGRLAIERSDEPAAREYNERARAQCVEIADPWLEGLPLANVAQLEQELGRFSVAADLMGRALARFREAGEPQYLNLYSAAMGDLCFEEGKIDEARRWYESAARFLATWVAHRGTALLYAAWGALEARHGDRARAEELFDVGRRAALRGDTPTVRIGFELHEASLHLRAARDAGDAGDAGRLAGEIAKWGARADALRRRTAADAAGGMDSIDVRFALRMLEQALAARRSRAELVVGKDGAWFAVDGGARVDLRRRGSLRRILHALVARHAEAPERALDQDALVERGWPGERLRPDAGSTRLRVAIATLRRLGLRSVLVTRDDGYLIDPSADVSEHL